MKEDFSELIEYLDGKFTSIDERFTKIESQLETKAEKADIDGLFTAVDAYAKKADTYFQDPVKITS